MSTEVEHDEPQGSFFPSAERMDQLHDEANGRKLTRSDLRKLRRTGERGRPPGSTNKRQEKAALWFMAKYGSPLAVFGEIMAMPLDVLMDQVDALQGGDAKHRPLRGIDIVKLKMEAADKAAPYVHSKMPVELQVNEVRDFILKVEGITLANGEGGGAAPTSPISLLDLADRAEMKYAAVVSDEVAE